MSPTTPETGPDGIEVVRKKLWAVPTRRQLILGGGAALGGAVLLGACGDDDDSSSSSSGDDTSTGGDDTAALPGEGKTIGLAVNLLNLYVQYVAAGVIEASQAAGYDFIGTNANFDVAKQVADIESMVAQGIDGLVILPVDAEAAATAAQLAQDAGVAVGHALWPGPSTGDEFFTSVAALDSVAGGRLIGEWIVENTEPGQIIVSQGIVGQGFSERIDEGLDAVLEGTDWEIVVREQGFFDPAVAVEIVETGIQANPDVSIIIDYSASMAGGISSFLENNGIENITHLTSDIDDNLLQWFGTPYLAGTRYYSPAQTGLLPALEVRKAIEGGTPTFEQPIDQVIATADNIDQVIADNPFNYPEYNDITSNI